MEQEKKPIYKKWWFWLIVVIVIFGMAGAGQDETTKTSTNTVNALENSTNTVNLIKNTANTENTIIPEKNEVQPEKTPSIDKPTVTMGQKNALAKAKSYLNYSAFSYSGLIKQLEFEGYTTEEATYGADNCGADWDEQAAKKAKSYMDYSSFSKNGLIKQLEYEGFTKSQAEYGAIAVGY